MIKQLELFLSPEEYHDQFIIREKISKILRVNIEEITAINHLRRSVDARGIYPKYRLLADIYVNEEPVELDNSIKYFPVPDNAKKVIIVGFGPAGMFAALRLIELGIKPIIFERGKDVHQRRKDLRYLLVDQIVNPDSNYSFGEGGAGTFSDGKLYTRATKRGNVKKIMNIFVQHGAFKDIMINSQPHIGSNKLPTIVENIRKTIISNNGEVNFNSRVTDFIIENKTCKGVVINNEKEYIADAVIIATGHSARDIYDILNTKNVTMEPKPFAMGVRIEHPQELINNIQYHTNQQNPYLPSANYTLTCQIDGRGVFSFCMCPGGIVVPSATASGEIVINGMSLARRNSPFANAGMVVAVEKEDMLKFKKHGVFAGVHLQSEAEKLAFEAGGSNGQVAPAQRITDFLMNKVSTSLPKSSYHPGLNPAEMHTILPFSIAKRLRQALKIFGKRMKGFVSDEGILIGVESRTSSPIRILRNRGTFDQIDVASLFPAGEGSGYAGGIVSSSIDGENTADAVAGYLNVNVSL